MKAKYHIGIISIILICASSMKAQVNDFGNYGYDGATVVVNNYQSDYDYYYSSRINRFHRSYSTFTYYAPVFTETYWYSYQPYSWGNSIYGGGGYGFDPYYYNNWYSPVVVNVRVGHYYPTYGNHHSHYNDNYHPANKSNNYDYNYPTKSYSNGYNSGNSSRRGSVNNTGGSDSGTSGGETRRYLDPAKDTRIIEDGNNGNNANTSNNGNIGDNRKSNTSRGNGDGVNNQVPGTTNTTSRKDVRTISNSDKKINFPVNSSGNRRSGTQYSTGKSSSAPSGSGSVSTKSKGSSTKATSPSKSENTQTRKNNTSRSESKSSKSSSSNERSTPVR